MSKIQVNEIVNHFDNGAPDCPKGLTITGVVTATTADFSGNVSIGGTLTYEDVTNIDSVGIITAQSGVHFGLVGSGVTIDAVGAGTSLGFLVNGSERVRIDSSGRLLVGTSSSSEVNTAVFQGNSAAGSAPSVVLASSINNPSSSQVLAELAFSDNGHVDTATIRCLRDGGTWTSGSSQPSALTFSTTADGASSPTERFRVNELGDFLFGKIASNNTSTGVRLASSSGNGYTSLVRDSNSPLYINRLTNDGTLVEFAQANTIEGTVSVSGNTVSYNPFLGSHWGRLENGDKLDIPIGTILETVDKLIEWKVVAFEVNGEQKLAAYNGSVEVGDTVQVDYEGVSYVGIVQNETENPSDLNKHVCVKINDVAASKAVFGVFLGWDNDVPEDMVSTWNDMYCAAVGNYFVRIKAGEVIAIGDLVEADGNGCGVIQDDDIIRTKTVAKITSTIPQVTYNDGSFLVTCVLYCG